VRFTPIKMLVINIIKLGNRNALKIGCYWRKYLSNAILHAPKILSEILPGFVIVHSTP